MTSEEIISSDKVTPSEREFLKQRLALVEDALDSPAGEYVYVGKGKARWRTEPSDRQDLNQVREAHLLRKLWATVKEGQVLLALRSWRRQLGSFLTDHRRRYQEMQEVYDAWWQLPPYQRESVPEPPRPPPPRYIDRDDAPWIVDDRFLALLDDLIERLQKWLRAE